ncbi:hypothetical protein [Paraoerskovia sediminicola]|nr:hypothetical protein [Paraoerskovia sediminicola]
MPDHLRAGSILAEVGLGTLEIAGVVVRSELLESGAFDALLLGVAAARR